MELIEYERRKVVREKKSAVRLPLPEHLRREIEVIEPEDLRANWVRIGIEATEILEFKPGELYVRRIERPKYAVKPIAAQAQDQSEQEEAPAVRIAPMPLLPLPRSNAGASLLAELLMNKYFIICHFIGRLLCSKWSMLSCLHQRLMVGSKEGVIYFVPFIFV